MTLDEFNRYKLGIAEIDEDHWNMFLSINAVIDDVENNNYVYLNVELEKLMRICTKHMENEIELMSMMNFPFMDTHITEHTLLTHALECEMANARLGNYSKLNISVENILINHIIQYDRLYADYARAMQVLHNPQEEIL